MTTEQDNRLPPSDVRQQWDTVPYPAASADRYRAEGLWQPRTIPGALRETVRAHPDRMAVVTPGVRWTYAELDRHSDAIAAGLLDAGLHPGESVILQITNSALAVATWYGLLKAGLLPVCTLAIHRRHEIEEIARQTHASAHLVQADLRGFDLVAFADEIRRLVPSIRLLATIGGRPGASGQERIEDLVDRPLSDAQAARLAQIDANTDLDAPAVLQLSGGTTGVPKVIPRLHPEYWYNAVATARWWGFTPQDRLGFGLPLVHNAGATNAVHAAHSVGAALLLATPVADDLLALMDDERATWFMSPPGLMNEYLRHPRFDGAFASVHNCVLTAAKVSRELFDAIEARGVHVTQAFGMTEGLFLFTPRDASPQVRATTVGVPISPLDEVVVLEPGTLRQTPPGEIGELCARGPYTVPGYLGVPVGTDSAFTPDGFYRSGDLVRAHHLDGLVAYSIEGRVKDLINRGGEKVNAEEVERILLGHELVLDAALVAMPDERLGERACAYLVCRPGGPLPTLDDVRDYLEEFGLARFKWPERIEFVDALPRTPIGKISKQWLREDIVRRLGGPPT
ncbi:AMP-binding protein [Micromonospora sp. NPDC007208]|uniref:AMP-binding protein n=1 Tax=Micromonospora sp. NPDC007208 TaxID=3364236 RepID=UPI0036C4588B